MTLRPWLDAQPWTLFEAQPRTIGVQGTLPTTAVPRSRPWADGLFAVGASTGRLENRFSPDSGTGFVLARGLLITARDLIVEHNIGWRAVFGAGVVDLAPLRSVERPPAIGMILLAMSEGPPPVRVSWALPREGQRIAVVAYPAHGARVPDGLAALFLPVVGGGEQAIVTGTVRSVSDDGSAFEYDAWTLAGAAGGPVVDVDTGKVVGVHHSGRVRGDRTKIGIGVPLAFLRDRIDLGDNPIRRWQELFCRMISTFLRQRGGRW